MAIKKIQLRGISRTPSDRMTADGGCAESLNVYLDNDELAPIIVPEDVTDSHGFPSGLNADQIFVHKTSNYEHYIIIDGLNVNAYVDGAKQYIIRIPDEEKFQFISSIGNTIIVATDNNVYYALWQNNSYKYIGNQLPTPSIQIDVLGNNDDTFRGKSGGVMYLDVSNSVAGRTNISSFKKEDWDKAARGVHEIEECNSYLAKVQEDLWANIQSLKNKIGKWGYFSCPRLVRYAVRLYDNSYVYHSVPILIGPGSNQWVSVRGGYEDSSFTGDPLYGALYYDINLYYKAIARLIKWDIQGWEDIVSGLDIFISTDITFPILNADFATCDDGGGNIYFKGYDNAHINTQEEILSKANFYKIRSIAVRDLGILQEGIDLHADNDVESYDTLVVKERLTEDYMTNHSVIPSRMSSFNSRLLINASKIILPEPYSLLNGLFCNSKLSYVDENVDHQVKKSYRFLYHIRRNNGEEYQIWAKSTAADKIIETPFITNSLPSMMENSFYADPMAWIAYPDPNCYKVDIDLGGGDVVSVDMSQHPNLYCSYAFIGLEEYFIKQQTSSDKVLSEEEYNTYSVNNQVMMSEVNNPFIYPLKNRSTFQSKVLGMAVATKALSQGQFGQFPLYVFTEDGVWAMETAADGSFVSSKPLSRDVCVNPDSITAIDNAVVFVTEKGVMLLRGSEVTNISPYMNGRHYSIDSTAMSIINAQEGFCKYQDTLSDKTPFMAFAKKASVAYDYAGQRLIFICEDEKYQYVYKLDTQTWHKAAHEANLVRAINSYPDCQIQGHVDYFKKTIRVTYNHTLESDEPYLIELIQQYLPDVSDIMAEHFLRQADEIDVTKYDDETIDLLAEALSDESVLIESGASTIKATKIYNLSTILDTSEHQYTEKGIIATRPFDLGEPDVLKTITDVRVRGQFARGAVKFILLGSLDGINFRVISTLRGKSWKLFRIIVLADLDATERISWIDVQYETRLTNKLR